MTPQKYLSKVRYQIQYQYQIKLEMSNRDSEQNYKMSHRKAFGFKSITEHVLNFVLVKKYLIYTLYEQRYL